MTTTARLCALLLLSVTMAMGTRTASAVGSDPRLLDITYDPHTIVNVAVRRGTVTLILLEPSEMIEEVATGLGADCSQAEAAWCIAAQVGGHSLFVKPKGSAAAANNLTVLTNQRSHSFRLAVVGDHDPTPPLYRLTVHAPAASVPMARASAGPTLSLSSSLLDSAAPARPADLVAERLQRTPQVANASYSLAEGVDSDDIVPTLVFDDGRFTYLRFPGNRPVPAVFNVLGDGTETMVNTRMEGDLLVVDLVGRRLVLRAGAAVVGIWNDDFDLDGTPPVEGTTVPGVRRAVQAGERADPRSRRGATP